MGRCLFQFLIGTIKTQVHSIISAPFLWFQFLIGTIKTEFTEVEALGDIEFQFLIGTIKTKGGSIDRSYIDFVSIPYRYYKNEKSKHLYQINYRCFNSL